MKLEIAQTSQVVLHGGKPGKNEPYCDGSHKQL